MKSFYFRSVIFYFLFSIFYFLPLFSVFAQTTGQINITPSDIANSAGTGGRGNVAGWVNSFYQFSLIAGVFLAVGVIVWAGLRYTLAAGNPSTQSDARDQILQAILGLILLFGAYLILYTINPNLVNLKLKTLDSVSVTAPTTGGTTGGASGGWGTGSDVNGQGGQFSGGGASGCTNCLTDTQARQTLTSANINIKTDGVPANLEGIQQSTVNGVIGLRNDCGCTITITSATDSHAAGTAHANGYKVDLRLNDGINNYITGNFTYIGLRGDDNAPQYAGPGGAIYAREGNHWDVLYR